MSKTAILVLHDGNQDYLNKCIEQARKICNDIKFIGKSNIYKSELKIEEFLKAEKSINIFLSKYIHMSKNPEMIEISCFKRYFYAYEYARANSLTDIWIIDSDVMIFTDLKAISKKGRWLDMYDACLSIPKQDYSNYDWAASPHTSWWKLEGLKNFTEFILDTYTNNISILEEKYNFNKTITSKGGVCDMTLLYLWSLDKKIFNFSDQMVEGFYIDHNINQKNILHNIEVKMKYGIKKINYDKQSVTITTKDGNEIKVASLHFQGRAKKFMGIIGPGFNNYICRIFTTVKLIIYTIIENYKKI